MGIRMEYSVEKLPDSYVTEKTVYSYQRDPDWNPDEHGPGERAPRIRVEEVIEERGGWLFTFMRGHQIRLTNLKQIETLGLSTTPKLVDDTTGLEVNRNGIPIDIEQHVQTSYLADGGAPDTAASLMRNRRTDDPIADAINDTE